MWTISFSGATNIAETQLPKDHQYLRMAHKLILVKTDEGDLPGRENVDLNRICHLPWHKAKYGIP